MNTTERNPNMPSPDHVLSKRKAYKEIISGLCKSGYNSQYIADMLLHLDIYPPTRQRVDLLSMGFGTNETERIIREPQINQRIADLTRKETDEESESPSIGES